MDGLEGGIGENIASVINSVNKGMIGVKNALMIEPIEVGNITPIFEQLGRAETSNIATQPVEVNQTININQPVSSPIETARAIKNQAITLGLAGV